MHVHRAPLAPAMIEGKLERETGVVVLSTKHPVEFTYRLA